MSPGPPLFHASFSRSRMRRFARWIRIAAALALTPRTLPTSRAGSSSQTARRRASRSRSGSALRAAEISGSREITGAGAAGRSCVTNLPRSDSRRRRFRRMLARTLRQTPMDHPTSDPFGIRSGCCQRSSMVSLTASSASSGDARRRAYRLVGSYTRSINASSSPTSYNASPRCLSALYQFVSQLYASFQGVVPPT